MAAAKFFRLLAAYFSQILRMMAVFSVGSAMCSMCPWTTADSNSAVKNSGRNQIPYEKSILYLVHVRGYTMSPTSGVVQPLRGTFDGLVQKIPYLQSLGVTAVELMPVYEMQSVDETKYNGSYDKKIILHLLPKQMIPI